jgi:glycopeptide antibiotics resistance protein
MRVFLRLPEPHEPTVLTRRHYFWIAMACLAGVIYGSFVPFHFQWRPINEAVAEFLRIVSEPLTLESGSDYLANVLLFLPLTFLWMATLSVERSRLEAAVTGLLILPAASLLSASIEFTQLYFPPRVTALDDIIAQTMGGAIGIMIWLAVGPTLTGLARRIWFALSQEGWAGKVLPAYAFFLILIHVMPINLTISPAMIQRKYHEGRIVLVPFANFSTHSFDAVQGLLWDLIYYAPLGWLLANLTRPGWRRWSRLPAVLTIATVAAFGMECLQIFVWSRESDVTNALVGAFAGLAGWVGTLLHRRLSGADRERVVSQAERTANYGLPGLVLLLWGLIVFYVGWQPFNFTTGRDFVAARQEQFTWVPFGDYRIQTEFVAFEQTLHKTLLFVPLGAILAATWSTSDRRLVSLVALLLAFMVASAVEVGQFYLPGHTASVTDVLIEMAGTLVGCVMGVRLRAVLSQASLPEWRTHGIRG